MAASFGESWQVFINFRGEELRGNFISHLERALTLAEIKYYINTKEAPSEDLTVLFTRIEQSEIALSIFSIKYAESKWCLDELVKITEQVKKGKLRIIHVFFNVTPEEVKEQKGEFGLKLYGEGKRKRPRIPDWENALQSVPSMIGLNLKNFRNERELVDKIVDSVKRVLAVVPLNKLSTDLSSVSSNVNVFSRHIEQSKASPLNYEMEQRLKHLEEKLDFDSLETNTDLLDRTFTNSRLNGKVKPPKIQVFINFRGVQLRNNFIGYLVDALRRSEINVFIDNHEQRGEDLNTLLKRIEDSGITIVVFSSRYTESKWCLDELVKIKERVDQGLLKVLPIFYKVTPTNVKSLKGVFGDHFRDQEYMYQFDEPMIKRWKEAIRVVSHKFALTLDKKSSVLEIDFVETIVKEVLKMLQAISKVESGGQSSCNLLCAEKAMLKRRKLS